MPLINLTVSGAYETHIPWTVVQVETGLKFSSLFSKIVAGAHPRLVIDEELSYSFLDKVHIGLTKDLLSIVDEQLNVDDVCAMFGQHVKLIVSQTVHEDAQSASASSTLPNAFEVLMASQKTVDKAMLPLKIQERNKKDKLFNDLGSIFENKGWEWSIGGRSHGQKFLMELQQCLWYIDGHDKTFASRCHCIPYLFEKFSGYNTPELTKHRKRSHSNLKADILRLHAGNLKNFLLCPWMKTQGWATLELPLKL